ncbi:hypothetical protein LOD99_1107 [Oopsacas minuta]|uniref:SLC41A/MgtE integral membrane domain-containing protein n=1 Tax=Oopsacas minuta TaxID=111878 RepID=A0AAV7K4X5_9METZ|nr:hypothetical protein LOD99_1107 [Oopsacas minuta]
MELENGSDEHSDTILTPICLSGSDSGLSIDSPPPKPSLKPPNTYLEVAYSLLQIFISSTLSGVGLVMAGLLLDVVQHWEVFIKVDELFILVPPLLGLKGNLEMTLTARLSTAANLGEVASLGGYLKVVAYNLSLIQGQATIVSILASCLSVLLGLIVSLGQIDWSLVSLIFASAILAACVSGLLLGVVMAVVVYLCATFKLNPDNLATPLAAALGDLVTLGVLSLVASTLYDKREVTMWIAPLIVSLMLPLGVMWLYVSTRGDTTKEVVKYGWTPLLIAMCISSLGGTVLDKVVMGLEGLAVYAPVINGTGGNLVAIQACRISTSLHSRSTPGNQVTDKEVFKIFIYIY